MQRSALLIGLALLGGVVPPRADAVVTFPGCAGTLQACLDAAAAGETVEIADSTPIGELLMIRKSVTLRGATGVIPVLTNLVLTYSGPPDAADAVAVVIDGIKTMLTFSFVRRGTSTLDVTVRNCAIETMSNNAGIYVTSEASSVGAVVFHIEDNTIHYPGSFASTAIQVANNFPAPMTGVISGNTITVPNAGSEGIDLFSFGESMTVDIVGNRITGGPSNPGVDLTAAGGTITARMVGNLLAHLDTGVMLAANAGTTNLTLANNTVIDTQVGMRLGGRADLGAVLQGVVANNLVGHSPLCGILIDPGFATTLGNHQNLLEMAGMPDCFSPGPGTIVGDPQLVSADDPHPRLTSPVFNAGDTAALPAGVTTDLDGAPRVVGPAVDIGAFELPCGNGQVDAGIGEQCDDGNAQDGDCCSARCQFEAAGCGACLACTPTRGCQPAPRTSCGRSSKGKRTRLLVSNSSRDAKDALAWSWTRGSIPSVADFGDPRTTEDYTFCLFGEQDAAGPTLLLGTTIPAGGTCGRAPCWSPLRRTGFRWKDESATRAGLSGVSLRSGDAGKASIMVQGKGPNLHLAPLPLPLPVRAQLQTESGRCWEETYSARGTLRSSKHVFRGSGD
jgi:cysteine-rich repeat protein